MRLFLKKEKAYFLFVDEDEDDEGDWDQHKYLDRSHSFPPVLLVLILLDVEAYFDERALLDADVQQVEDLINVDVDDVAAQLVRLQLVAQAAKEEKEQALQVCCETDYLQKFEIVLPPFYAADRPFYPGLQWLTLSHDVEIDSHRT